MSITSADFWKRIKALGVKPDDKLLLALSGGADSVTLFHLLFKANISFSVAHVNYGLRGDDSLQDEIFCRDLCEKNRIPFFVYDASQEMKNRLGVSLQELARNIRYDFFRVLIEKNNFDFILTAHHANDSVETFFVNVLRNSGAQGLKGIPEKNGNIIRPLLKYNKKEIDEYITENHLSFREDGSNKKYDYLRNRIRHHVIPALETADNSAVGLISATMKKLSAEAELLDFFIKEKFASEIDKTEIAFLQQFPESLIPTVIFKRFQPIGINFSQAEDLAEALKGIAGKQFTTGTHQILLDRGFILVQELKENEKYSLQIFERDLKIKGYEIEIMSREEFNIHHSPWNIKSQANAFLDADKLQFPLTWRNIQTGDSMKPLGMKGRKKISDILIDAKKSRFEKDKLHVLCSGNEIVWLEGFRISDSSKITAQTCRVLCLIPENL